MCFCTRSLTVVEFTLNIISSRGLDDETPFGREAGFDLVGISVRQKVSWPELPRAGEQVNYHRDMRPAIVQFVSHCFLRKKIEVFCSIPNDDFRALLADIKDEAGWEQNPRS